MRDASWSTEMTTMSKSGSGHTGRARVVRHILNEASHTEQFVLSSYTNPESGSVFIFISRRGKCQNHFSDSA